MKKTLLKATTITFGIALLSLSLAVTNNPKSAVNVNATDTANAFNNGSFADNTITWTISGVGTIVQEKGTGQTAPNSSYVKAPRWYSGNKVTFTPAANVTFNSMVFTANTADYATALANSTWSTGSATSSSTTTTWEGSASSTFTVAMGAQSRMSSLIISYTSSSTVVNTLTGISLSNYTTEYLIGDTFAFDGKCTASYDNGDSTLVAPTSVTEPDMSTAGTKSVTVSYTDGGVTKSANYSINVSSDSYNKAMFDLSTDTTLTATTDEMTWATDPISIEVAKGDSSTNVNNYYPGIADKNYQQTRMYRDQTITFTSKSENPITRIKFIAANESYSEAAISNTCANASIRYAKTEVVVTPNAPTTSLTMKIASTQGYSSIVVSYSGTAVEPEEEVITDVTVAEALDIIDGLENNGQTTAKYAVTGYITGITTAYNGSYGNLSFNIADTANGTNVLECFRVTATTEEAAVYVKGAKVKVTGYLSFYYKDETYSKAQIAQGGTCELLEAAPEAAAVDLANGAYFITTGTSSTDYMLPSVTTANTSSAPAATAYTSADASKAWTFTKATGSSVKNAYTIKSGSLSLYATNTNNGVRVADKGDNFVWQLEAEAGGTYVLHAVIDGDTSRKLSCYSSQDWRTYTGTNGVQSLYLVPASTTPVTPDPEPTEDEFAIVAPDEMDYDSIMNYSFENALPESQRSAFVVWVANDDVQYSMNAPDSNEISIDTSENAVITTLKSARTFYIHAYYTVNANGSVVYATKQVTINYGLSNLVSDFGELRTYCNNGVNPNVSEITSTWEVLEAYWDDLSASEKATFKATVANASAATTTLENTAALYDLLVAKYNLTNFASRSVSSMSRGLKSITKDTATTAAIVAVAAISSISLVGALAVSKKRKEN